MKLMCLLVAIIWCVRGESILSSLSNLIPTLRDLSNWVFQNKCIEDLGCFYTGPPFFHIIYRPISLPPADNLTILFYLFTPNNPQEEEDIDTTEKSIEDSSFNPQFPLKVLIHGYLTELKKNDVRYQTKDEFLKIGNYNVIIVDWTKDNGEPYSQAVANARAVGAKLANLLKVVMKVTGLSAQNIHLIGHSLGAHVAGYAGERVANIGRITGLDPAGPYFQQDDPRVRLDITDALFLDIVHTNGHIAYIDSEGLPEPIGHLDFYPNGGKFQPGCPSTSDNTSIIERIINYRTDLISCSHNRANDLFKESIDNSRCRFLAVNCTGYFAYQFGWCTPQNSVVSEMGYHAKKIEGLPIKTEFYLETNDEEPFCIKNSI